MRPVTFNDFRGLDLRRNKEASDPRTLLTSTNIDIRSGGQIVARDGLKKVATLDSESVGLYSANGVLRSVIPCGHSIPGATVGEVLVMYDAIGDSDSVAYPTSVIDRVTAVETIGASAISGVYPYVVIKRTNGTYEHHWIRSAPVPTAGSPPTPSTDPVNTKVSLPFQPGADLLKLQYKLWATDNLNGAVRFSSTLNGPSDWTNEADAGYLPVLQHVSGSRTIRALGYFNGLLVVLFADAIQLWFVDPDPSRHALQRVMNGPGTDTPGATENVLGDLMYFSRGGFRSLKTVIQTGEPREGDVGAKIQALTSEIDTTTATPIALWSQARSQYLCAVGSTIYAYTLSEIAKQKDWSTWVLPFTVDYMVEHNGQLFVRSGDDVYRFDPDQTTDDGTAITWRLRFQYIDLGSKMRKQWNFLRLVQTGTSRVNFYYDARDPSAVMVGPELVNSTQTLDPSYIGLVTESMSIEFTGTGRWQLDSFTLDAAELSW
jgi:hypothetical protein